MSEPFGSLFTTGHFAALCGTTKDTLFHYDRIGLLKPRSVGSNGYRRYTSAQLFDFDLIRVLQQAGSTLEEIKWYRQHYDSAHFLLLLEEKQAGIRTRLEQLARMEQMLAHVAATTRRALAETYDVPRAEPQQAEQLLVVGLKKGEGEHTDGVAARVSEHLALCEKYRLTDRFPLGSVILKEDVLAGSSLESYFFSRVPPDFSGGPLLEKPAGLYATIVHKGPLEAFNEPYHALLAYVGRQGYAVCGNAYVFDLITYLASGSEQEYVVQISIQIEKRGCPRSARG